MDAILAVGAHPDDVEFGCGGTLAAYAARGYAVHLYIATDGSEGGDAAVRREEQARSAVIMGVRSVVWGGYDDTEIPLEPRLIADLDAVVRRLAPGMVFVHAAEDTRQDHRYLARATISATRHVPTLLCYEGPTTVRFAPSCSRDIAAYLDIKLACLDAHASQVSKTSIEGLTILELAKSTANFRGIQARVKYAEGFRAVRMRLDV